VLFRVFGCAAGPIGVAAAKPSSYGIRPSSRVPGSLKYRPDGLGVPALSSAISSALRFSLNELQPVTVRFQSNPLFEFHVPPESFSTHPSRLASASPLLS
jgi:hypothetical protein